MKKILVIDNRASTRNLFLESLKVKGFYCSGAENGFIGVRRAQLELPDLIISEIMMPELDGYDVLRALRQKPATAIIPLIFVTDQVNWANIRKGMELGADDYLIKSCTIDELLRAIATRLEKQAALKQWYASQSQPVPEPPHAENGKSTDPQSIFPSVSQLSKVFDYIEANYHQPINVCDVAQAVGYSATYLTDLMRRRTGDTLHSWIVKRRMVAACSLLLETDQSVEQIAEALGYRYAASFFRQFRQSFGMTPQAWRNASRIEQKC
ncbi:helix-turn-helix domain-containing protein [Scytonema sp. PCC 10023]|uniref:response regulator transcription factor n=1 Tax=Scytonema sp. PCC 10023 TaxID=1680591 RepID=UPI0039C64942